MSVASMTGFGRARGVLSERLSAAVVVRSVNHRYLDIQTRTNLKEELPEAEALARRVVAERVRRGRVVVQVHFERTAPVEARLVVDSRGIRELVATLRDLEGNGPGGAVGVADVLAVPGLVTVQPGETVLTREELDRLGGIVEEAVTSMVEARQAEGSALVAQIVGELEALEGFLHWIEPELEGLRERLLGKVRQRLLDLLGRDADLEEARLVQEAALLADRADVAEEVVRLREHLGQFRRRLRAGGAVGRALDFLCQEIHRELNTLGSKAREAFVVERLVDAKTATERIREQVQNLE